MSKSIKDRIAKYISNSNHELLPKLPVIITINGGSFQKSTSLLEKPFDPKFAETMCSTLLTLCHEISGAFFGYSFNDELTIFSRNDQHIDTLPWYDNNIQKIISAVSSIATISFNNYAKSIDLQTSNSSIFISNVFTTPTLTEAINVAIFKQQEALKSSAYFSCFYELLKKYKKSYIKDLLANTSQDDKINILQQECNIDINEYPLAFRRGFAVYRAPKVYDSPNGEIIKNKWHLNTEIPIFTQDFAFLKGIFSYERDVLRNGNQ